MTAELIVLGTLALILVFIAIYALVQPGLTRRDLLFGVTVAPGTRASPAGRAIIRRYQALTIALTLAGLAALVAVWAYLPPEMVPAVAFFAVAGVILISGLPQLWAYFAARRLARSEPTRPPVPPSEPPSAELRPRRYGDYVPWLWELLPLAIIAATVLYLAATYPQVPARFPSHFDAGGTPNGYSTKSIASYFSLVWTQLSLEILLTGLALLVVGARALPGEAEFRFRRAWLRFLYVLKAGILGELALIAVGIGYSAIHGVGLPIAFLAVPMAVLGAILVGTLILALRTGQGGSRLSPAAPATDRMSDRYWILGSFYINRDDPAVFVERRFGIGWTLNFGNPLAWLVILLIVALAAGSSLIAILSGGR